MYDVIVIGGGAAGFYGALHIAENQPDLKIAILERGKNVLSKVKISGGGRCNITNAETDPVYLSAQYPRGSKELLGPFYTHGSRDTMAFFEERGIALKSEKDGRIFPVSDNSQTVIDFFLRETAGRGIEIIRNSAVLEINPVSNEGNKNLQSWKVSCKNKSFTASKLLVTPGSSNRIWHILGRLGYTITQPVPSLFSFNIDDERISGLQGISCNARVTVIKKRLSSKEITVGLKSNLKKGQALEEEGPLLITHWGLSGPAILRLSAWGARELFEYGYKFRVKVNWVPDYHERSLPALLKEIKTLEARKTVFRTNALEIPRKLWGRLVKAAGIPTDRTWAHLSSSDIDKLSKLLVASEFSVHGKSTYKEEFVTAGGVDLSQINFGSFSSKLHPNIYFAGEVLNIDGITGGFNFQAAWTGSYMAAMDIASGTDYPA